MLGSGFSGYPRNVTRINRILEPILLEKVRQLTYHYAPLSPTVHSAVEKIKCAIIDHGNSFAGE